MPTAAMAGQSFVAPWPRATATPSGPRNSSALAVPSGSRSIAAMKHMVTPAVATPSTTAALKPRAENEERRGRRITRNSRPAQVRRRQAAPSGPTSSKSPTDAARPSWTQIIEASAIPAPVRVSRRVTSRI